jgi:hypothetical protein
MNRAVWFAAGAGAGAYALTRARRAAEILTPDGLADRLAGLSLGLHLFGAEVRAGMAEKEHDVRERIGLARHHPTHPELSDGQAARTDRAPDDSASREGNH